MLNLLDNAHSFTLQDETTKYESRSKPHVREFKTNNLTQKTVDFIATTLRAYDAFEHYDFLCRDL